MKVKQACIARELFQTPFVPCRQKGRRQDAKPPALQNRHKSTKGMVIIMEIAIIADDSKKELMTQFCIAYCGILSKYHICSTSITGKYIEDATGLDIEKLLPGTHGGVQQICSRVSYNEIDLVLYFGKSQTNRLNSDEHDNLLRMCDSQNVPVATNIATAEVLVCALERGDLDWREIVNPSSEYNKKRRQHQ